MTDTMLHYQGSGRLVDLVPRGLLNELACASCAWKVWYIGSMATIDLRKSSGSSEPCPRWHSDELHVNLSP